MDGNRRVGDPLDAAAAKRFPDFLRFLRSRDDHRRLTAIPLSRQSETDHCAVVASGGDSGTKERHKNRCSGFFLGFDLDDEVHVVPDRTQVGLHAEIRALESAAGGKTS